MTDEGAAGPQAVGERPPAGFVNARHVSTAPALWSGRLRLLRGRPGRVIALASAGLLLELALVSGLLLPLAAWRQPIVIATDQPLATAFGDTVPGALRFAAAVLVAFAAFALAVAAARGLAGRAVMVLVLAGTVLFALTLLPINPAGSHDIYHNVADARTVWRYHSNPLVLPPNAFPDDPFYPHVPAWQDFPSVYGPVWYAVSALTVPLAGDGLWANLLGQKLIATAFLLATTALAMLVAGRIRPGAAALAGVLTGWNPLLLFETAGNAHNDIVMVCFAIAALYAVARRWWMAVFPLLALSVASKYVLVLLGPVLLVWMLRRPDVPRRHIALSLALGAAVGMAVYVPFFAGADMLAAFQRQSSFNTSSPSSLLHALLMAYLGLDEVEALRVVKLTVVPLYLAAYALLLVRIPAGPGLVTLVRACFWTVFLLLVIATWWFWPWYLVFLVPFGALLPGSRPALIGTLFAFTAMLMYLPYFWLLDGDWLLHHALTAATAFLPPVLLALAPRLSRRAAQPVGSLAGD